MKLLASFRLRSEGDTECLGAELAKVLPQTAMIVLTGTLGAGKTRLVQAVAHAKGISRRQVTSPTFTLWQTYATIPPIHHLDAYRINDDEEFLELGVEELFTKATWTFIEWGERFRALLPEDALAIEFATGQEDERILQFRGNPGTWSTICQRLAERLPACQMAHDVSESSE